MFFFITVDEKNVEIKIIKKEIRSRTINNRFQREK